MSKQSIEITDYLNSTTLEAFRVLSINLGLNKKIFKVISIIGYNPGEGRTTVAINLAIVGAKSGTRVLYVDADLRKPRHLKRNEAVGTKGLTDFCENTKLEDVICQTGIDNLTYVTAGNRLVDPVEFLSSQSFDRFIEAVSQQYEMVVIDSTALGHCVDGAIVAAKVSGVLVVTRSQKTSYKNIERIKWQMKSVGANIIGIVINRVEKRDFRTYFIVSNSYNYLTKFLTKKLKQSKVNQ